MIARILICNCFLLLSYGVNAQNNPSAELTTLFQELHENGQFNGAVLVAENGEILHERAYGFADYEARQMMTLQSPCYLASVSKQFTTMGIMILQQQGKLSFDDPLTKYFPEFPAYAKSITLRHLMTHTSGIPDHYGLGIYKPGLTNDDVFQVLIQQEQLQFEPGSQYRYSNGGYVLLALIIEDVSGLSLPEFMQMHIFMTLDMQNSCVFHPKTGEIPNRVKSYTSTWTLDDYEIFTTGAGGLFSTVEDLYKWDQALYTDRLVSPGSLEEAFTSAVLTDGSKTGYGYGWGIAENETGGRIVRHTGSLNGYRTLLERDLENKRTIILLTNHSNSYLNSIIGAIRTIFKGQAYELPKISIAQKIHKLIKTLGVEAALQHYDALKANETHKYTFDQFELNGLGYHYLNSIKDYPTAIAIFQKNVDSYPTLANPYDSLGEAYLKSGNKKKAIENYKTSFTLNPGNENALKVLEEMGVDISEMKWEPDIPEATLASFTGVYQLNPDFAITVSKEGRQLKVQATGQGVFDIFPMSHNKFFLRVVEAQVQFNATEDSSIESMTLYQNGMEQVLKRVRQ